MEINCYWLPQLEIYDHSTSWELYSDHLYSIFKKDFIETKPVFKSKKVNIRKHPIEFNKEEAFFHVTCKNETKNKDRTPDFRRAERIRWIRAFIENYDCQDSNCQCNGVIHWVEREQYDYPRTHILFEREQYIVVVEERDWGYLLITAYYIEYQNTLRKLKKRYLKSMQ